MPTLLNMSVDDLIKLAANLRATPVTRYAATKMLAWRLEQQLERGCAMIFPDFYWSSSGGESFHVESLDYLNCTFPGRKKMRPDNVLMPERDAALRDLGFTHCDDTKLGLTQACQAAAPSCLTLQATDTID